MWVVLLVCSLGRDPYPPIRVDRCELNQIVSWCPAACEYRPRLLQWEWCPWRGCYVVREWRLSKTSARPMRIGGRWILPTYSSDKGVRVIEPRTYAPSWSTHDPEIDNRSIVDPGKRVPLR